MRSQFGIAMLLLLMGVLAPTVCVLWFMNQAARLQADSARQSITDAYRGQLWLIRDRVDGYWAGRGAVLQAMSEEPLRDVMRSVSQGVADSIIFVGPRETLPPGSPFSGAFLSSAEWLAAQALEGASGQRAKAATAYRRIADAATNPFLAARAAEAEIRCLVQAGDKELAIQAIRQLFAGGSASVGVDTGGRWIAADEQLLALQLMTSRDRRYAKAAQALIALVNDYGVAPNEAPMPSTQRLFLMDELRTMSPASEAPVLPTYAAERLAAQFRDVDQPTAGERTLQPTRMPGVWKFASPDGRVIALYRTDTIVSAMHGLLDQMGASRSVKFATIPPGAAANSGEAIPAGPALPGWRIAFTLLDTKPFDEAAHGRMVSYLWAGFLVVGAIAGTGILAGQSLRRQWRLARLKTDLLAAVSHELRTPLASMQLLVEALLDENKFEPEKTRDYLELMAEENRRLSRLIGNFLTFSRIERNRQRFEFTETKPADVVRGAVQAMGERLHGPACNLEIDVAPGLPALRADRDALVTVLLNLLDNAHKYTPSDRRIVVQAYREGSNVVFAVKDNGIGIAAREQKRIFRRFYQIDRRLTRETGGCGLGLSIVDFIVRAHGGEVRVESSPGAGSTFRVLTPFGIAPMEASA